MTELKGDRNNPSQLFRLLKPSIDEQGRQTSSWKTVKNYFDTLMRAWSHANRVEGRTSGRFAEEYGSVQQKCTQVELAIREARDAAARRRSVATPARQNEQVLRAAAQRSLDAQEGAPQGTVGRAYANLQARRRSEGQREGGGEGGGEGGREGGGEGGGERRRDPSQDEPPRQRARAGVRGFQRRPNEGDAVRDLAQTLREVSERQQASEASARQHENQTTTTLVNSVLATLNQMLQSQHQNSTQVLQMIQQNQLAILELFWGRASPRLRRRQQAEVGDEGDEGEDER